MPSYVDEWVRQCSLRRLELSSSILASSQLVLISTPRGNNKFYEIYKEMNGMSKFKVGDKVRFTVGCVGDPGDVLTIKSIDGRCVYFKEGK